MNKQISNLIFFAGQIVGDGKEYKTKLAYTDNNFTNRNFTFSSLIDNPFL